MRPYQIKTDYREWVDLDSIQTISETPYRKEGCIFASVRLAFQSGRQELFLCQEWDIGQNGETAEDIAATSLKELIEEWKKEPNNGRT